MTTPPPGWKETWEAAQRLWGVRLHDPVFVASPQPPSFAWFSFPPQITIDTAELIGEGADSELESVFAHEIGHHVLSPATRLDGAKIRHQLARALTASNRQPVPRAVALLSNLWSDQLINVRVAELQRRREPSDEPGMVRLWRRLTADATAGPLDWVLRRAYEVAWVLPPGTLCDRVPPSLSGTEFQAVEDGGRPEKVPDRYAEAERKLQAARSEVAAAEHALEARLVAHPEADAVMLARLVKAFGQDPITGALGFGMLMAPYLPRQENQLSASGPGCAGEADPAPVTAAEVAAILGDPRLAADPVHPAGDPRVVGTGGTQAGRAAGQGYGVAETIALYSDVDPEVVLAVWYRTAAQRWARPLTVPRPAPSSEDLPGPLERWEVDDELARIDWSATLAAGPEIVPGVTTRQRSYLDDPEHTAQASVQLDLYIDSSGSMPHPRAGSPAVLAATILTLSVLRGGGSVRVTSWSGPSQVSGEDGYGRDPTALVAGLAFFFGGGTSFPLDLLQARYGGLPPADAQVRRHLVVLSDDGLTSMFGVGNEPWAQVAARVRPALTTATLVLMDANRRVAPLAAAAGYQVIYLESMQEAPAACAALAEVIRGVG